MIDTKKDIACEDMLISPQYWDDEPFELIVSNPPYSIKWAGDDIIQLPSNLFFGTSIAACIMVLKKGKPDNRPLFIDTSGQCVKVTNNNKLTQANIDKIVEVFSARAEESHFSHLAGYEEIEVNAYSLYVSTYVEAEDTREKIDIVKLNAEIEEIVACEQVLRDEIAKIIAGIEVDV